MDMTRIPGREGSTGPFPADYNTPHVYARDVHSGAGNCLCGRAPQSTLHVPVPSSPTGGWTPPQGEGGAMATADAAVAPGLFDPEDLIRRFTHHPPTTADRMRAHERARGAVFALAVELNTSLPRCDEAERAILWLEEALFWANAAIARWGV